MDGFIRSSYLDTFKSLWILDIAKLWSFVSKEFRSPLFKATEIVSDLRCHGFWILQNFDLLYRVSQKKCPDVSNCHNSLKIGTRNKSRVSFEILSKSSCWWQLKFFTFDFWGLKKWGLKLLTLCLKSNFLRPVFFGHN